MDPWIRKSTAPLRLKARPKMLVFPSELKSRATDSVKKSVIKESISINSSVYPPIINHCSPPKPSIPQQALSKPPLTSIVSYNRPPSFTNVGNLCSPLKPKPSIQLSSTEKSQSSAKASPLAVMLTQASIIVNLLTPVKEQISAVKRTLDFNLGSNTPPTPSSTLGLNTPTTSSSTKPAKANETAYTTDTSIEPSPVKKPKNMLKLKTMQNSYVSILLKRDKEN